MGLAAGIAFFAEFKTDNPAGDRNLYGYTCSITIFGCQWRNCQRGGAGAAWEAAAGRGPAPLPYVLHFFF